MNFLLWFFFVRFVVHEFSKLGTVMLPCHCDCHSFPGAVLKKELDLVISKSLCFGARHFCAISVALPVKVCCLTEESDH